jgi:hypothetical protein
MSQEIRITIRVPDGAVVGLVTTDGPAAPLDDFEDEPIPLETFAADEQAGEFNAPVNRTIAHEAVAVLPVKTWVVGQVHTPGHKALRLGKNGNLFCPTPVGKRADGSTVFCPFKP